MTAIALRMRRSFDMKNRRNRQRLIANTIGLFILVFMIFPVYWMVATAFKPPRDILRFDPKWIPSPFTLDNFDDAIHRPYFWDNVKNSVIIVGVVVVLSLVVGFLAALAIARFSFYGRRAFIVVIIGVQMIRLEQRSRVGWRLVSYQWTDAAGRVLWLVPRGRFTIRARYTGTSELRSADSRALSVSGV